MTLQNNTRTQLQPALLPFGCCSVLQVEPGKYSCRIHVDKGNVLFRHTAYNIYTGSWEDQPDDNEKEAVLIHEGETQNLEFTCKNHSGQPDNICFFNDSYLKPAVFTCSCRQQ